MSRTVSPLQTEAQAERRAYHRITAQVYRYVTT